PFADALGHYNPTAQLHPNHAGDMPPLILNGSNAYLSFITGRFRLEEVIGRTVIVHSHHDDFTTQPSGGAGEKIACGVIRWD
ncbi:MAG: superoxide dismutase family protein, partial [Clostridia bacterium]